MRAHCFLPALLLSAALAGTVGAQEKAQPETPRKTEAPNPYQERFQQLDRDKDGFVSPAEWPLERAKFDLVDRDRDGRLSRTELLTPNVVRDDAQERLRRFDTDGDGRLNAAERQREAADHQARLRQRQNTWNPRATLRDQRRFRDLDRNRDNRLTRTEVSGSGAGFNRLDRNGDGVLTPNEWPRQ
jgi:Ca2+-binding EF-hand superfamily protein